MNAATSQHNQKGAVALITAWMLLIGITSVTLITAKSVVTQTEINANDLRSAEALSNANAALDHGRAYFDENGPAKNDNDLWTDGNGDGHPVELDFTEANPRQNADGTQQFFFSLEDGNCALGEADATTVLVVAEGWSDDAVGYRRIESCVSAIPIFGPETPKQPLASRGSVALTGNYTLINRYFNTTIWSGEDATLGMSSSAATYLRHHDYEVGDLTKDQIEDPETNNTYTSEPISDRDKGNGVDTIGNDPNLRSLTADECFENFFFADRETVKGVAQFDTLASLAASEPGGIAWISDGDDVDTTFVDAEIAAGDTYGSPDHPVVIVIDGNLALSGGPTIYGMLYVRGQLTAAGGATIIGSVVVEGDEAAVPEGERPVSGSGNITVVYSPFMLDPPSPFSGTTGMVSGTWRDWPDEP